MFLSQTENYYASSLCVTGSPWWLNCLQRQSIFHYLFLDASDTSALWRKPHPACSRKCWVFYCSTKNCLFTKRKSKVKFRNWVLGYKFAVCLVIDNCFVPNWPLYPITYFAYVEHGRIWIELLVRVWQHPVRIL